MARTWLSVAVELLGGRGHELWPPPGRTFAVGPAHSFDDLADAINTAFARWDRGHLSLFDLADGNIVTDVESGIELADSTAGPTSRAFDSARAKVTMLLEPGDVCRFTFDLGDRWVHQCTVHSPKIDPAITLGIVPAAPLPYCGWGTIPDQYGRRTADDDGSGKVRERPNHRHPMLDFAWPHHEDRPR
ncbi:IS1096 element passenger TnpR family protein [Brevibacterium casei]|uniref:IS1096 element passenger TnpR family protein n=1 Tax=Brevibacterium casei TaxID=33889 RepID=UPI000689B159|nr:hypothetical protein [Brevibacterium casei]